MKKVILKLNENVTFFGDLKRTDSIGFTVKDGFKGYIVCVGVGGKLDSSKSKLHAVIAKDRVNNVPNAWSGGSEGNTPQEVIDSLAWGGVDEVFKFETQSELYEWLSKPIKEDLPR